jgi:hypothetical protein
MRIQKRAIFKGMGFSKIAENLYEFFDVETDAKQSSH